MSNNNQMVLSLAVAVAAGAITATAAQPSVGIAVGACAFLGAFVLQQGAAQPAPLQQVKSQEPKKKSKKEKSKARVEPEVEEVVKVEPPKPKSKSAAAPKPAPKEVKAEKPAPASAKKPQAAPAPAPPAKQQPKAAPAPKAQAPKAQAPKAQAPAAAVVPAAAQVGAQLSKSAQKRLKLKKKQDADQAERAAQQAAEAQKRREEEEALALQRALEEQAIRDAEEGWQTQPSTRKSNSSKPKKDKKEKTETEQAKPGIRRIPVEGKKHGRIIGTGGETLRAIQDLTGVKITMPKAHQGTSIVLEGDADGLEKASQIIDDLVTKGYSSHVLKDGHVEMELPLPDVDGLEGRILGTKGANLQAIQKKLGVRVIMPEKASKERKVTLIGKQSNCDLAAQALNHLIFEGFSPVTHEGWIKVEFEIPRMDLSLIIGKQGSTIQSIQETTKARVNIPRDHDENQHVTVVGPPASVAAAEKRILEVLAPPEDEEEEEEMDSAWQEGLQEVVF